MLDSIPYWARVAALVALMVAVAGVEIAIRGRNASRWKEYGFVLGAGLAAGLFGLANDLVTSSISPDYFVVGKGLPIDTLRRSAGTLGFQAGFSAGAIAAAFCVYLATRRSRHPAFSMQRLAILSWRPFVLAVALAMLLPLLFSRFDPLGYEATLAPILTPPRIGRFIQVWWIHTGLYLGLLAGVAWIAIDICRRRKRDPV